MQRLAPKLSCILKLKALYVREIRPMRNRDPHENNPFNPLFKVAALRANWIPEEGKDNRLSLDCSLNFKMAQSVSGKNTDSNGRVAESATFSLSIKRAELSVRIDPNGVEGFSIEKIAHMVPGHTLQETEITTKHMSDRGSELGARIGVEASNKAKQKAELKLGGNKSNSQMTKRKITLQRTTSSVIGTFDNTKAHWEIKPNVDDGEGKHKEHISGEIFLANDQDQRLSALIASWKKGSGVYIELCASVRVQLKDLNISDVRIFDEHGEELSRPINAGFLERGEDVKLKFVKQLIKRHLVDLGLENSAGSIEVCRAYA